MGVRGEGWEWGVGGGVGRGRGWLDLNLNIDLDLGAPFVRRVAGRARGARQHERRREHVLVQLVLQRGREREGARVEDGPPAHAHARGRAQVALRRRPPQVGAHRRDEAADVGVIARDGALEEGRVHHGLAHAARELRVGRAAHLHAWPGICILTLRACIPTLLRRQAPARG